MEKLSPESRRQLRTALARESGEPTLHFGSSERPPRTDFEKWLEKRGRERLGPQGGQLQLFLMSVLNNLPYMMLACIPLFALVLKGLYLFRKIYYVDHLIYALIVHAFAYLGTVAIILLQLGFNRAGFAGLGEWIVFFLWLAFVAQIFRSIRTVYRQGWLLTTVKFLLGGIVYLFVLLAALLATFLVTLALPD